MPSTSDYKPSAYTTLKGVINKGRGEGGGGSYLGSLHDSITELKNVFRNSLYSGAD